MLRNQHSKTSFFPVTRHPTLVTLLSVNAKPLEQPVFQAGPSRCESGHGRQFSG